MEPFDETPKNLSIECVDNAEGLPGVVVYDDQTFPVFSQQADALGADHGPHSSVRAFYFSEPEDEETAVEYDPLQAKTDSYTGNDAPPVSSTDDEED